MALEIPIRADVAADYHPDFLVKHRKALDIENSAGPRIMAAGREALAAVYKFVAACNDAEQALQAAAPAAIRKARPDGRSDYLGDLRMTHGGVIRRFHGHENEFAAAADEAFKRVSLTTDRRNEELAKYRESLVKSIAALTDDPRRQSPEGIALATEIRAHAKEKGIAFITKALQDGDKTTVAAVLAAPAYLSGITEANKSAIRKQAALRFAPMESAQLEACDEIIQRISDAQSYGMRRWMKAQEYKQSTVAKANEKIHALAGGK